MVTRLDDAYSRWPTWRMEFGICNEIHGGWSIDDAMNRAASAGYDAIEIAPFTIAPYVTGVSPERRRYIKRAADKAGIAVSGTHWVLSKTEGLHLTHPDVAIRNRTAGYYRELVRFCADIGGAYIVNGSPKQREVVPGVSRDEAFTNAIETLRPALTPAEEAGIVVCMEPLAPAESNFIDTAAEAAACDSPAMKIILDVKAMCSEGKPIPEIIRSTGAWCAYFHANDKNLKGPGFGDVDFEPIAGALHDIGYEGYVSVEVFSFDEGPERIAVESLAYLRSVFS